MRNGTSNAMRDRIKKLIKLEKEKMEYTDTDIANKLGVSRQAYLMLLNGKNIHLGNLEKIADILNCEIYIKFVPKDNENRE